MNPGFKVFSRKARERALARINEAGRFEDYRRAKIEVEHPDHSVREHECCPIGLCLIEDGYLKPSFAPAIPDRRPSEYFFEDGAGRRRSPYAPGGETIRDTLIFGGVDTEVVVTSVNDLALFYKAWDDYLIRPNDLASYMLEDAE